MQRNISHASNSSSSNQSPAISSLDRRPSISHRHTTSGVTKRRKPGPLKDIVIDPNDKVAAKRARNTLAARESRNRKAQHVEILEAEKAVLAQQISELEAKNEKYERMLVQAGLLR